MMLLAPAGGALVQQVPPSAISQITPARIGFWILAAIMIGAALFTITRKNAIAAVMSLVATFFGLAACYALLSAHFLAALQVLVYAGAIMVLFIFVVMVLNRDDPERVAPTGLLAKAFGVGVTGYLVYRLARHVVEIIPQYRADEAVSGAFGTVAEVGELLFTDYLFAFEAVSILLLIAVVAAVVIARVHKAEKPSADADSAATPPPAEGGGHP